MKKINSKQQNIKFSYCPAPMTIDKSKDWGKGNIQYFPDGVFLKHREDGSITHGVQPNQDHTAPVGWEKQTNGLFRKQAIWVVEQLAAGQQKELATLDGLMLYEIKETSFVVCQDIDGKPNTKDAWIMKASDLQKSYCYKAPLTPHLSPLTSDTHVKLG